MSIIQFSFFHFQSLYLACLSIHATHIFRITFESRQSLRDSIASFAFVVFFVNLYYDYQIWNRCARVRPTNVFESNRLGCTQMQNKMWLVPPSFLNEMPPTMPMWRWQCMLGLVHDQKILEFPRYQYYQFTWTEIISSRPPSLLLFSSSLHGVASHISDHGCAKNWRLCENVNESNSFFICAKLCTENKKGKDLWHLRNLSNRK